MQLIKCADPKKRGITLEETSMDDIETKGLAFKSLYGSDGNTYEKVTDLNGQITWFILEED